MQNRDGDFLRDRIDVMSRFSLFSQLVALCVALMTPCFTSFAAAQNPFLQNRGKRTVVRIEFVGNEITKEYVLRRELGFEEGDSYDPAQITDAWERLEALPFIAYVDIETVKPTPTEVELVIRVEEDRRFLWSAALDYERRYNNAWLLGLNANVLNLRGRAETLELRTYIWKRKLAQLSWNNPSILGPARLGVWAGATGDRYNWEYENFRFTDWELAGGVWRDFGPWLRLKTSYHWREVAVDEVDEGVPEFGLSKDDKVTDKDPAILLSLVHDSRDMQYYPSLGLYARIDGRFAGLGVDRSYRIWNFQGSGFYQVSKVSLIVAGHAGYRIASDPLPFYEKVHLGGPMDVRGVDFGTVRGDEGFVASVELRRPIVLLPLRQGRTIGLGLHAFHDWGKAWAHGQSFGDRHPRYSFGAGVHLNFNTRNYRFEWARTDEGDDVFVFEDRFTF